MAALVPAESYWVHLSCISFFCPHSNTYIYNIYILFSTSFFSSSRLSPYLIRALFLRRVRWMRSLPLFIFLVRSFLPFFALHLPYIVAFVRLLWSSLVLSFALSFSLCALLAATNSVVDSRRSGALLLLPLSSWMCVQCHEGKRIVASSSSLLVLYIQYIYTSYDFSS